MGTLINVTDVDLSTCRLFDCRAALSDHGHGERAYAAGHIPGALRVDLETDLSDPVVPGVTGRHPLPSDERFLLTVRQWGIRNSDSIVIYDDNTGAFAARMWWMMRWLGHDDVQVLDGGFAAWHAGDRPITTEVPVYEPSSFRQNEPLTWQVSASDISDWSGLLLDARDAVRFRGEQEPVDPVAGHIPGAVNAPFVENLADGLFKSADTLQQRYAALGAQGKQVACYCGSGVTAAHLILALRHAGYPEPALYPGSWSEWITDPSRPVE